MKHLKIFEEYKSDILVDLDENKYQIVYNEDIIPDTNYGVYQDTSRNYYIVDKSNVNKLIDMNEKSEDDYYSFEGVAVTIDYYSKYNEAKRKYEEAKSDADSIRSSDDQYYDPSEDYTFDEYSKYYKKGNWSTLFWDFQL